MSTSEVHPARPEEAGTPQTSALAERAREYTHRKQGVALADYLLGIGVLAVFLFTGWSQELRSWALGITPNPAGALALYLLALTGLTQALSFPLDLYSGHVLEHQFELSRRSFRVWLQDWLKARSLSFALGLAGTELVYWTLRHYPESWWLLCASGFVLFFILLTHLAPVLLFPLFFKFEPLPDDDLRQRLLRLSERAGAHVRGVWLWKLSEKSKKANAALVGWGRTRRILLADTLLGKHTPEEVEVILAHELAHHVHNDLWKGMVLQSALTLAGFYAVHRALRAWTSPLGFTSLADFANLPLLLLTAAGLSLLVLPAANAYSRARERQADAFALRTTGNREAFIGSMEKLAEQNLSQRQPHPWIEFIFYSHPSIEKRIAFAKSWRA